MTQTDLPQLSLQRYFDLVKRRRWQLVPVTLIGLIFGGLVALLIPRYYVAETVIVHNAIPGQQLSDREARDPFRSIVQSARDTIPGAVEKAIEKLKWPEGRIEDLHERTEEIKEIRDRISVIDNNPDEKRSYARIQVFYRDLDGNRAADFANMLVRTWQEQRVEELRIPAEEQMTKAIDRVRELSQGFDSLLQERSAIALRYKIEISSSPELQLRTISERRAQRRGRENELVSTREELVAAQQEFDRLQRVRDELPEFVPAATARLSKAAVGNELAPLLAIAEREKAKMTDVFHEGTEQWRTAKRSYERMQSVLRKLLVPGATSDEVPNPERAAVTEAIDKVAALRARLLERLRAVEELVEQAQKQEAEEVVGLTLLQKKDQAIRQIDQDIDHWDKKREQASEILATLQKEQPVKQQQEATPPPRPTDPNILVVALIGSLLGLMIAIGLILLIDVMQGSFKTVDDVERALGVPVLGGISHLETEEQRVAAVQGRRRASLVAFALVAMVVIVVTIYYIDPTRLPSFVRDGLALLLGK